MLLLRPELSARQGLVDHLYARIRRDEAIEAARPGALAGIVRARELGRTRDGLVFLVTERAAGVDLAAMIAAQGRLPWQQAVRVMAGLCAALGRLHAAG